MKQIELENWIVLCDNASDGLAVFRAWLKAWHSHPNLGHIDNALFDAVLADMQRHGLGSIINDLNTKNLRRIVTGVTK